MERTEKAIEYKRKRIRREFGNNDVAREFSLFRLSAEDECPLILGMLWVPVVYSIPCSKSRGEIDRLEMFVRVRRWCALHLFRILSNGLKISLVRARRSMSVSGSHFLKI